MNRSKILGLAIVGAGAIAVSGCASIREPSGYIVDATLLQSVQPGIDNEQSVASTLGRPTFESQYGEKTWYYVSSTSGRKPFVRPRIKQHSVLAVKFDPAGNVVSTEQSGIDKVAYLSPDGDATPTLGRERSFLEDLFGNIGAVTQPGVGPGQ